MQIKDFEKLNLPDTPGVYTFYLGAEMLYIGKATSLYDRVRSYFSTDLLTTRGMHILNMVTVAETIKYTQTRSVLEALLLESQMIKQHKPKYNTKEKDDRSYYVLGITDEVFPRVLLFRQRTLDKMLEAGDIKVKEVFGPYGSGEQAREALRVIRKIFPFRDKCEIYDSKHPFKRNPCFAYQVGLCPGVCAGVCDKRKYKRQIEKLILFLKGDGEAVRRELEKEMGEYSKKLQFEEAQRVKDTLFALEHVRDAHLIHRDRHESGSDMRIEAYDIAHISGSDRVGVMTVLSGGVPSKSQYKKFKLKEDKNDDLEGLAEIFTRRLKHLSDWGVPDVIVVDGDDRHVRVAEKCIKDFLASINEDDGNETLDIKIVAVTKGKGHKAKAIIGERDIVEKYKNEIVLANAEAHRFALRYHRELRGKAFKL
jgi:excinuclease ABC subunit C